MGGYFDRKKSMFLAFFASWAVLGPPWAPRGLQEAPKRPPRASQEAPKRPPGGPKRPPGGPREAPKRPQEAPKSLPRASWARLLAPRGPQEASRRPEEAPKRPPGGTQEAPKRPQEAPENPFRTRKTLVNQWLFAKIVFSVRFSKDVQRILHGISQGFLKDLKNALNKLFQGFYGCWRWCWWCSCW